MLSRVSFLVAFLDQIHSINGYGSCDTTEWVETTSTFASSGNRAASSLIIDDCTILCFGGIYSNAISLDTSQDSPSWEDYSDITGSYGIDPFWPTTKGAMFMRYSNGTVDESYMYMTCDNNAIGDILGFEVSSQTWTEVTADMPSATEDCCAFALDDKIYVFGGQYEGRRRRMQGGGGGGGDTSSATTYDLVQIYDVSGDSWSEGTAMTNAREDMGCEMVVDEEAGKGYVYLVGGAEDETVYDSIEMYDISDDSWTLYDSALSPKRRGVGVQYIKGTDIMLLIAGEICYDGEDCGEDGDNFISIVEVFNLTSGEVDEALSSLIPNVTLAVAGAMSAIIYNDECGLGNGSLTVYVMGGEYITDVTPSTGVSTLCLDIDYNYTYVSPGYDVSTTSTSSYSTTADMGTGTTTMSVGTSNTTMGTTMDTTLGGNGDSTTTTTMASSDGTTATSAGYDTTTTTTEEGADNGTSTTTDDDDDSGNDAYTTSYGGNSTSNYTGTDDSDPGTNKSEGISLWSKSRNVAMKMLVVTFIVACLFLM